MGNNTDTKHIDYPKATMYEMIKRMAEQTPSEPALEFYGRQYSFGTFLDRIDRAACTLYELGIRKGDAVTICMPNIPQALDVFYGLDKIGAVANMVHPLSAVKEVEFYLNISESKAIITVDMFYEKVMEAVKAAKHPVTVLVTRMQDELPILLKAAYLVKKGHEYLRFPKDENAFVWKDLLKKADMHKDVPLAEFDQNRTSVILYSGGTSGTPKGICLSDYNINVCAIQARSAIDEEIGAGLTMLGCMPIFHGFGLGMNIHTVLIYGACCILMPTFNIKTYTDMLVKRKPSFIAGVPTIFEALLHMPDLEGVDLSFLHGMFCGGDSLSVELKKKIDLFLKEHGASIQVREGYGLTECVTASCLTPSDDYRTGSIGLPFPDTVYCIVRPDSDEEVPRGEEGEIIITGPSVMLGYLKNPEETGKTLRKLADGRVWLYTGDLGYMDEDGFIYYKQRIKRIIITNGYNVYPGQIENVIDSCPEVSYSCVIGVKDPRRMARVRAYIVLRDGYDKSDETKEKIMKQIEKSVAGYALPKEIVFRDELPKTLVGKVAYKVLTDEANAEQENR